MTLPAMTGMELLCTKEFLGLTTGWLADRLVINARRITRMEAGHEPVPQVIVTLLDEIDYETKDLVARMTADLRRKAKASESGNVTLRTYRTEDNYPGKYTARWHRQLCARVAAAVPGLILEQA